MKPFGALLFGIVLSLALVAVCCRKSSDSLPPGPPEPAALLEQYDRFADRVQREALLAAWNRAIGIPDRTRPFGVIPLSLLTDAEVRALRGKLADEAQVRALDAISDRAFWIQADSPPGTAELLSRIRRIHSRMAGYQTELLGLVEEENPKLREDVWKKHFDEASKLEPLLRSLLKAREQWARDRGANSFLAVAALHRGYDPETAQRLAAQIRNAVNPSPADPKRDPWDREFNDPGLMRRLDRVLNAEDCLERCEFALGWAGCSRTIPQLHLHIGSRSEFSTSASYLIQPPLDIRLTIVPGAGIAGHWTTLHEFGHAAMALAAPDRGPFMLRRAISGAVSESCGKMAERLALAPEWLRLQDVPEAELASLRAWEQRSELARMRSILADLEFESAAYRSPQSDLRSLYARIQSESAGLRHPADSPAWALQRHLAFEPLERMDYLLARCAQAAIYRRMRSLSGGLLGRPASRILQQDVLQSAAGSRYEEWFRSAAGVEPDCAAWIEDVAGRTAAKAQK